MAAMSAMFLTCSPVFWRLYCEIERMEGTDCYAQCYPLYITPSIHEPHEYNNPLALLILNRMTGRYTPDSTVLL